MKKLMTPTDPRTEKVVQALAKRTGAVRVTGIHESVRTSKMPAVSTDAAPSEPVKEKKIYGGDVTVRCSKRGFVRLGTFYVGESEL